MLLSLWLHTADQVRTLLLGALEGERVPGRGLRDTIVSVVGGAGAGCMAMWGSNIGNVQCGSRSGTTPRLADREASHRASLRVVSGKLQSRAGG